MQGFPTIIIIGGGAAGVFAAIACAEAQPRARVLLLEKAQVLLSKVRISGGGRCNVTHACFDPYQLVKNYPRGGKALLGPFHRFQPRDTISWFFERGVELKTEEDGRMFPVTDLSQTIIDCLMREAGRLGVEIRRGQKIGRISKEGGEFKLFSEGEEEVSGHKLVLATGSSPQGYRWAEAFGHKIIPQVPSLFTFNVPSSPLLELSGVSVENALLKIEGTAFEQQGPLLITHWGFSGPVALKLSAWAALFLHEVHYKVTLLINWIPGISREEVAARLVEIKQKFPNHVLGNENPFSLPKNLWKKLIEREGIDGRKRLGDLSNKQLQQLASRLFGDPYQVEGKTTYKQEFVTAGGVCLDEVNFKTMESKLCPGLHFAGEILDIDGVTGGFNFQNAWTTGWIAGNSFA